MNEDILLFKKIPIIDCKISIGTKTYQSLINLKKLQKKHHITKKNLKKTKKNK